MSTYPRRGSHGVWRTLGIYESTESVTRLCREKTGCKPSPSKAREIVSLISQGREYFQGAVAARELVRPLILYYGAMSFARALVLFSEPGKSKLTGSHGLGASGWEDLNTKPEKVPELPIAVCRNGTFPELWNTTKNIDRTRIPAADNPFEIEAVSEGTNPAPDNLKLTIRDVLGQITDLREVYEGTFGEHGCRLKCEVQAINHVSGSEPNKGSAQVGLVESRAGIPDRERVASELDKPEIACRPVEDYLYFASEPRGRNVRNFSFSMSYDRPPTGFSALNLPVVRSGSTGELCLKLPTTDDIVLSDLLSLYLIAYATGMLVRYHPGYWMTLVGRTKGDAMAPALTAAASVIEELFPRLTLEELES